MKAESKKTFTYVAIGAAVLILLYFVFSNMGAKKKGEGEGEEKKPKEVGTEKQPEKSEFFKDLPFEAVWSKDDEDLTPAEEHKESEVVIIGDYSQSVAEMQRRLKTWGVETEIDGKAGGKLRSDVYELTGLDIANGVKLANITEKA